MAYDQQGQLLFADDFTEKLNDLLLSNWIEA
jgi:hypothetical protein